MTTKHLIERVIDRLSYIVYAAETSGHVETAITYKVLLESYKRNRRTCQEIPDKDKEALIKWLDDTDPYKQ